MSQRIKKGVIIFFALFVLSGSEILAQGIQYTLLESQTDEAIIRVEFPKYTTYSEQINGKTMYHLVMEQAYPELEVGTPELLKSAISIIVPENSHPVVEIISSDYLTLSQFELAPSKGRLLRNVNYSTVPYTFGTVYEQDRFLHDIPVSVGEPYQLRDYYGVAVQFYPFSYNPVQKQLRVYSNIVARVRFNSTGETSRIGKVAKAFDAIYQDHFLNYASVKSTPLEEEGDILILAPESFCVAMQPYATWKIQNGYATEIVSTDSVGSTSTAIQNYISTYYNNHNLVYVLLVGDDNYFPTITVGGNISDNYYAEIVGSDVYPDVIIGKISAETAEQVENQVSKFISYEQAFGDTIHFPVFVGIGSGEGPGDNSEYDWQHVRNIDNVLSNYTYTSGYEFFEGSHGGLDDSGDPSASNVTTAVNAGVGIINYTGHGSETAWSTSSFSNTYVNALTNYDRLPFIISVACLNGLYTNRTCFAEAWMRATKDGRPTGAVGALMSTISQPWNSPMCAQDYMIEILTGTSSSVAQKRTFGSICFNGLIKMLDSYNDYEVARTWILFGDPALMVRTAVPQTISAQYDQEVRLGTTSFIVHASVESARVVITRGNEILDKGTINGGSVTLSLPYDLNVNDTLHLVVSAPNYIPAEGTLIVIPNDGPYVVLQEIILHDNGNNDSLADYGETVMVDVQMKNAGVLDATNIQVQISTDDPYLTVQSGIFSLGTLQAEDITTRQEAFSFVVSQDVPAFHSLLLGFTITYNDTITQQQWQSIVLHAPSLQAGNLSVNDQSQGNGNGRVDVNETVNLTTTLCNNGNGAFPGGTVYITNPDGSLELFRYPQELPALAVGESYQINFRAANRSTNPTQARIHMRFVSNDGRISSQDLYVKVSYIIEDWESGDLSSFEWVNNSTYPWTITTQDPYEGTYAIRSGACGHSANSTLYVSYTNTADDTLSFYYKVSSEEGYDFLKFSMDNTIIDSWSGNIDWSRYALYVSAGTHTFRWQYTKDAYMSSGSDMAMLDNISFPGMATTTGVDTYTAGSMMVMPNPTGGACQIVLSNFESMDLPRYQIFDMTGRLLQHNTITGTHTTLSLSDYSRGVYVLKILDNNQMMQTFKIVKE